MASTLVPVAECHSHLMRTMLEYEDGMESQQCLEQSDGFLSPRWRGTHWCEIHWCEIHWREIHWYEIH